MCERKGGEGGEREEEREREGASLAAEKCTLPSAQLGEEANVKRKDEAAKSKTSLHTLEHVE